MGLAEDLPNLVVPIGVVILLLMMSSGSGTSSGPSEWEPHDTCWGTRSP